MNRIKLFLLLLLLILPSLFLYGQELKIPTNKKIAKILSSAQKKSEEENKKRIKEFKLNLSKKSTKEILAGNRSNFGASIIPTHNKAIGKLWYRSKKKINVEIDFAFTPEGGRKEIEDGVLFKGILFQPQLKLKLSDVNLSFQIKSKIATNFSSSSFKTKRYNQANRTEYNIRLDYLDFFIPKTENINSYFFIKGKFDKNSSIHQGTEIFSTSSNFTDFGIGYNDNSILKVNMGLQLISTERKNFTHPTPIDEFNNRLNLHFNIGINIEEVFMDIDFSPMITQSGEKQQIMRNIVKIAFTLHPF